MFIILTGIVSINLYHYFILYPKGLPNKNTPFGKIIAKYLDSLPLNTTIYITSCCWGERAQPKHEDIYYEMKTNEKRAGKVFVTYNKSCEYLTKRTPLVFIADRDLDKYNFLRECFSNKQIHIELHRVNDQNVFYSILIGN